MNTSRCDQFDGYLAGWLSDAEVSEFEAHLAGCPACRRQLDQQGRIDSLLAQVAGCLEPDPPHLVDRIEAQIQLLKRRRTIRLAWGLSAAAVAVLLVGVWLVDEYVNTPAEPQPVARRQEVPAVVPRGVELPIRVASHAKPLVRIRLSDPSAAILVSVETESPNLSIVWFHPTVKPARLSTGTDIH